MSWYTSLLPTATLVLGAGLSEVRSWLGDRRKSGEVARTAAKERARAVETRRETFELDHLVKLNEALLEFGRAYGHAHFLDLQTGKATGAYGVTQLPKEVDEHCYSAGRQVLALMNMVLDDDLRATVRRAYDAMVSVATMNGASLDDARDAFNKASELHDQALEAVAARVRAIYIEGTAGSS